MLTDPNWLIVGRFGRVHGLKGFITVQSYTEPRENILGYAQWSAYIDKQWQNLEIVQRELTDQRILVQVAGFKEREQVARLTNLEIAVPKETLPALDVGEFYWHQLVGMSVVTPEGEHLGIVTEMLATGSNDVLVVTGERRLLIPYLPGDTILKVDITTNSIEVLWDTDF